MNLKGPHFVTLALKKGFIDLHQTFLPQMLLILSLVYTLLENKTVIADASHHQLTAAGFEPKL